MRGVFAVLTTTALLGAALAASAEVVQRASAPAGSVIQRKSGEEVLFVDLPCWRGIDVDRVKACLSVLRGEGG